MTQALAFSRKAQAVAEQLRRDIASAAIVLACGLALIFADQPLPL